MTKACDVTVLGAGPYGLSAAAHLAAIPGLDVRIFGEPMEFWSTSMPQGMILRSPRAASNIDAPDDGLTVEDFYGERGDGERGRGSQVPLNRFVEYGLWFQRRAVPWLERKRIERVEPEGERFRVVLRDGESFVSKRVVVAGGIAPFARRPEVFARLPKGMASHVVDHRDLSPFKGKSVVMIGAGQAALETSALLHEAGARVEILCRDEIIRWHGRGGKTRKFVQIGPLKPLLYASTGVGPILVSRIVSFPYLLRTFPRPVQDDFLRRCLKASASWDMFQRLQGVRITLGRRVVSASETGGRARLTLTDGTERLVDHVLCGTGYKVDVSRYNFLAPELAAAVAQHDGFPRLGPGFESSVPGLHFMGAPAVWSFGPLMHFVVGTEFSGGELARRVAKAKR